MLLILMITIAMLDARESDEFMAAISATRDTRDTLIKDLQKDQGDYRSEFTGCPSPEQFAKILEDEKRYNEAARVG
jgi:hypothetical protein